MMEQLLPVAALLAFMSSDQALRREVGAYLESHRDHPAHAPWLARLGQGEGAPMDALAAVISAADQAQPKPDGKTSLAEVDQFVAQRWGDEDLANPYVLSLLKLSLRRFAQSTGARAVANHLAGARSLDGVEFFAFRHGDSVPSSRKEVCGDPVRCSREETGLAPGAEKAVADSADRWIAQNRALLESRMRAGKVVIAASPFRRTRETAAAVAARLQQAFGRTPGIELEWGLRERFFGDFEALRNSQDLYEDAWRHDPDFDGGVGIDAAWGIETPLDVAERTTGVLARYQDRCPGHVVVLVAHDDALKLLEAALRGQPLSRHADASCQTTAGGCVKSYRTTEYRGLNPIILGKAAPGTKTP